MNSRELLDALSVAERLKDTTRHCYTSKGRHESVAEHSWMMTLMAFFMRDEFPNADCRRGSRGRDERRNLQHFDASLRGRYPVLRATQSLLQ